MDELAEPQIFNTRKGRIQHWVAVKVYLEARRRSNIEYDHLGGGFLLTPREKAGKLKLCPAD